MLLISSNLSCQVELSEFIIDPTRKFEKYATFLLVFNRLGFAQKLSYSQRKVVDLGFWVGFSKPNSTLDQVQISKHKQWTLKVTMFELG